MNENIDPAQAAPLDVVAIEAFTANPEAASVTPSLDVAKTMFDDNPGLSAVLTKEGWLHRNGQLVAVIEAHGT
jgi:hypothetical protein